MANLARLFPKTTQYQHLIDRPQPQPPVARMPTANRAIQFGAFAAVAGERAIKSAYNPNTKDNS